MVTVNLDGLIAGAKTGRKFRRPSHSFQLRQKPWTIQPFCIAPVLPGETMKSALIQARAVSDPIKNPLVGWWAEYYLFYVKHRDLAGREDFTAMMLDLEHSLASYNDAADVKTYHPGPGINWTQLCLERVVEEYFRDEGEAWNIQTIDGMPAASVNTENWMNSLIDETTVPEGDPVEVGDTPEDMIAAMNAYEFMVANAMINMSYEDYLRTYGVKIAKHEEQHRPELIRYVRDWTYPSNTVDPATGAPSSAASWAIAERADKDRFFKEPGFIFGVSVFRPKVYFKNQDGSAASMLDNALAWLPALMSNDPWTSLKSYANNAGPIQGTPTNGYIVDVKDLFLYGDQFLNFATTAADASIVALPTASLNRRYAAETDADALFKADTAELIRQDGVCSLQILGAQVDTTPRTVA